MKTKEVLYIDISSATKEQKEALVKAAFKKGYCWNRGDENVHIPAYANYVYLRPHYKSITYSRDLVEPVSRQIVPVYSQTVVTCFETVPTEIHMHGRKYVLVPE